MASGPGLFSDIGKKAKDLLTRDYISDPKVSVSTSSVSGVSKGKSRSPNPRSFKFQQSAAMGGDGDSSSSSGEEDGDAEWRAAINSVASTTPSNGTATTSVASPTRTRENKPNIKLYQIKAQKLLDDILEKSLQVVRQEPTEVVENHSVITEGGVRLFRDAPRGILFDHVDELQGPLKRPRIAPNVEVDEKSKKFRKQLKSVVVDGDDIICSAKKACERSLAKLEARDAAAKAKAKEEEERVAELKRIRGERWLPANARQMRSK